MDAQKRKKIANNILEFLFDPTVIPVERRMYFRPEEILKNQSYEQAKAEADKTYGDQRHNSDFYPPKNKMSNESEASSMDRKSLIASMDILSQTFKENDPIAKDLRTMAYAVSQMSDEELESRLIAVEAAETFKCPKCGTKVLKQTGYCVKCKKKVKPKTAGDEASENKEAEDKTPEKKEAEDRVPEINLDEWSKAASDAVKRALIADVVGEKEAVSQCTPAEDEEVEDKKAEEKEEDEKKAETEEKTKEAGKKKGPGVPDGTGPMKDSPECPNNPKKSEDEEEEEKEKEAKKEEEDKKAEDDKEAKDPKDSSVVNTDVLGFEMEAGFMMPEDIGDLDAEESAKLDQLFK